MLLTWNEGGERRGYRLEDIRNSGSQLPDIVGEIRKMISQDGARCYAIALPMGRVTPFGVEECIQLASCSLGAQSLNSLGIARNSQGAIEEFKDYGRVEAAGFEPGGVFRTMLEPFVQSGVRH